MKSEAVKFIRKKIIRILANRRFSPVLQWSPCIQFLIFVISDRLRSSFRDADDLAF